MAWTAGDAGAVGEVAVFPHYFKYLADPRQRGKVPYPLDEVLLLHLLSVLAESEAGPRPSGDEISETPAPPASARDGCGCGAGAATPFRRPEHFARPQFAASRPPRSSRG